MRKFSLNTQKDTRPLAGLLGLKQILLVPLSIFGVIVSLTNIAVYSAL